jgi:hypothetical protein
MTRKIFQKSKDYKDKTVDAKRRNINGYRFYEYLGLEYPSVTSILPVSDGIKKWKERVGESVANAELIRASNRGTKLHKLIEEYISGADQSVHDILPVGLFKNMQPELDKIDNIILLEKILFGETLGFAGQVDCIADYDGVLSIIDFKSANRKKSEEYLTNYYLQATGYSMLYEERYNVRIDNIVLLIAGEDGSMSIHQKKIDEQLRLDFKQCLINFERDIMPSLEGELKCMSS